MSGEQLDDILGRATAKRGGRRGWWQDAPLKMLEVIDRALLVNDDSSDPRYFQAPELARVLSDEFGVRVTSSALTTYARSVKGRRGWSEA